MIRYTYGNLFDSEAEVIVNTVNCEGFMGKGIAYQFKNKYPEMFEEYKEKCNNGELRVGRLHMYTKSNPKIINFPTKNKWREKSKINYINEGLIALAEMIEEEKIKSIAMPPLGTGNGGLAWGDVKIAIERYLKDLANQVEIVVYEPSQNIKNTTPPIVTYEILELLRIAIKLGKYTEEIIILVLDLAKCMYGQEIQINDLKKVFNQIKQIKEYYSINDNERLFEVLLNRSISENIIKKINKAENSIDKSVELIRKYPLDFLHAISNRAKELSISHCKYREDEIDNFILENSGIYATNLMNEIVLIEV